MKGHVGGGPVSDGLWASDDRSNFMPFLMDFGLRLAAGRRLICLKYANTPDCEFVQERLPEMPACSGLFRPGLSYINLRV